MKKWIQNRYKQLRTLKQAKQINKIDLTIKTVEKKGKYLAYSLKYESPIKLIMFVSYD